MEGSKFPIMILSDNANLRFFMTTKELSGRQARWAEQLSAFDFEIFHRPGVRNPADAPSRRPDYAPKEGEMLQNLILPDWQAKLRDSLRAHPEMRNPDPSGMGPVAAGFLACLPVNAAGPMIVDHMNIDTCGILETSVDESCADGGTGIPVTPVPRIMVRAAMTSETAYSESPTESMAELLRRCQLKDTGAERNSTGPGEEGGQAERLALECVRGWTAQVQ